MFTRVLELVQMVPGKDLQQILDIGGEFIGVGHMNRSAQRLGLRINTLSGMYTQRGEIGTVFFIFPKILPVRICRFAECFRDSAMDSQIGLEIKIWFFSQVVGRKGSRSPGFKGSSVCYPAI